MKVGLDTAREFLDFRGPKGTVSDEAAEGQLRGAVALHNILETHGVAYLADEVGMGKTYVALGAVALFRHFDPQFRVLVIAPRENIQRKWMKEMRNFVRNNVRFADLRVKDVHGAPARPLVACANLVELVREASLNPDRDFFVRLTSFSLAAGVRPRRRSKRCAARACSDPPSPLGGRDSWTFDLREKSAAPFKDRLRRAVCAALPEFDLVIVDEGHNLKHGFVGERLRPQPRAWRSSSATRPTGPARALPGLRPAAKQVLFLSATPVEERLPAALEPARRLRQGRAAFDLLADEEAGEAKKRDVRAELPHPARHRDPRGRRAAHEEPLPARVARSEESTGTTTRSRSSRPRPAAAHRGPRPEEGERAPRAREVRQLLPDRDARLVRELPRDGQGEEGVGRRARRPDVRRRRPDRRRRRAEESTSAP